MQEHKIVLTLEAIYDLTDIADYIEMTFGIERADKFQNDIRKQIKDLEILGKVFSKTHIYYRNYSIYKKIFSPSIIFYIVKEPEKEIHILRILREERDWGKVLTKQHQYTYPE